MLLHSFVDLWKCTLYRSVIQSWDVNCTKHSYTNIHTSTTRTMSLVKIAVKFRKVSKESLGQDETLSQTCHKLLFHKYLSPLLNVQFMYSSN